LDNTLSAFVARCAQLVVVSHYRLLVSPLAVSNSKGCCHGIVYYSYCRLRCRLI